MMRWKLGAPLCLTTVLSGCSAEMANLILAGIDQGINNSLLPATQMIQMSRNDSSCPGCTSVPSRPSYHRDSDEPTRAQSNNEEANSAYAASSSSQYSQNKEQVTQAQNGNCSVNVQNTGFTFIADPINTRDVLIVSNWNIATDSMQDDLQTVYFKYAINYVASGTGTLLTEDGVFMEYVKGNGGDYILQDRTNWELDRVVSIDIKEARCSFKNGQY